MKRVIRSLKRTMVVLKNIYNDVVMLLSLLLLGAVVLWLLFGAWMLVDTVVRAVV